MKSDKVKIRNFWRRVINGCHQRRIKQKLHAEKRIVKDQRFEMNDITLCFFPDAFNFACIYFDSLQF